MIVRLTDYQMKLCKLFSEESAKTQQRIEFGQRGTERTINEIAKDNLIGKMGEAAVAKMLNEEFHLHVPTNFEIYQRGDYDDNDLEINGWSIDVKTTRRGKYLLLEKHKVDFRIKLFTFPDVILMCRVPNDDSNEVEIIGCISASRLINPNTPEVRRLKMGDYIPNTLCQLQADNYCVRFQDLCEPRKAINYMIRSKK